MTSQLKKPDPFSWLAEHWPKSTIFLAVYTFGILSVNEIIIFIN